MSELLATRIREGAGRLRLANLEEHLDTLVERAEAATMGYLEFLDLVLEEETGVREGRRFRNALKLSGLPHHKTLDEFDFAFQPELDQRKVKDLASLAFVSAGANVAFLGPPGVGKTMLAVGLAVAACQAGFSVYFTTLDDMVRNLREAEASGRFAKKLQTYLKPAVLVVDEIGYLPLSRAEANMVVGARQPALRAGLDRRDLQQGVQRMGSGPGRRGPGVSDPRPPPAPLRRRLDQRTELPAQGPRQAERR